MATWEATWIYQFITNNQASLHWRGKEKLVKHQKFSIYSDHGCIMLLIISYEPSIVKHIFSCIPSIYISVFILCGFHLCENKMTPVWRKGDFLEGKIFLKNHFIFNLKSAWRNTVTKKHKWVYFEILSLIKGLSYMKLFWSF